MYLAIDVGGTKTLLAAISKGGDLKQTIKFETSQDYNTFLDDLTIAIKSLGNLSFSAACIALPGVIDRKNGIGIRFGNLPWENTPIIDFLKNLLGVPVFLENDAKLAGLYEASNVKKDYNKVVYVTISTGIGIALIIDGVIDVNIGDRGGNAFMIEHEGKTISWERLASGKAITERYGKKASDIDDPKIWKILARDFALGLIDVIALLEPEAVIVGGGVGAHFDKFGDFLRAEIEKYDSKITTIPKILPAQKPEQAVIYGCYELLKSKHG